MVNAEVNRTPVISLAVSAAFFLLVAWQLSYKVNAFENSYVNVQQSFSAFAEGNTKSCDFDFDFDLTFDLYKPQKPSFATQSFLLPQSVCCRNVFVAQSRAPPLNA